jgi:hypothetical protein
MKICRHCNKSKDLSEFGIQCGRPHTYCRACCNIKQKAWQKKHRGYRGSGKLKRFADRKLMQRLRKIRTYANGRSECTLSDDFLLSLWEKQEGKCALSGIDMVLETNNLFVVSLDQINPGKGYAEGNVQLLTWAVNRAKGEIPLDQFITLCQQIVRRCNDYPEREYSQVAGSAQPLRNQGEEIVCSA